MEPAVRKNAATRFVLNFGFPARACPSRHSESIEFAGPPGVTPRNVGKKWRKAKGQKMEEERAEEREDQKKEQRHGSEDPTLQRRKAKGRTEVPPLHLEGTRQARRHGALPTHQSTVAM